MVRWIGLDFNYKREDRTCEVEKSGFQIDKDIQKQYKIGKTSIKFEIPVITSDGKGLTIEDYCLEIANEEETFLFLLKNVDMNNEI